MAINGFEAWVANGTIKSPFDFGVAITTPLLAKTNLQGWQVQKTNKNVYNYRKTGHQTANTTPTPVAGPKTLATLTLDFDDIHLTNVYSIANEYSMVELRSHSNLGADLVANDTADANLACVESYERQTINDFVDGMTAYTATDITTGDSDVAYQVVIDMIIAQLAKGSDLSNLRIWCSAAVISNLMKSKSYMKTSSLIAPEIAQGMITKINQVPVFMNTRIDETGSTHENLQLVLVDLTRVVQVINDSESQLTAEKSEASRWPSVIVSGRAWYKNYVKKSWSRDLSTGTPNGGLLLSKPAQQV